MLVTKKAKTVTNILKLSPKYFDETKTVDEFVVGHQQISEYFHQHQVFPSIIFITFEYSASEGQVRAEYNL